jgi:hypothetical protein
MATVTNARPVTRTLFGWKVGGIARRFRTRSAAQAEADYQTDMDNWMVA